MESKIKIQKEQIEDYAVQKTGDETIDGKKSFLENVTVDRELNTLDHHSYDDSTQLNITDDQGIYGFCSYDTQAEMNNSVPVTHLNGYQSRLRYNGSANMTNATGYNVQFAHNGTGILGNLYGIHIQTPTGTGTITNKYGIVIGDFTGGYGIFSGGGNNYFAGKMQHAVGTVNEDSALISDITAGTRAGNFTSLRANNLSPQKLPFHVSDASGLIDSPIATDGAEVFIGGQTAQFKGYDLEIIKSGTQLLMSDNITDLTNKSGRVVGATYTNSNNPLGLLYWSSTNSSNTINIGGGSGIITAPTAINFYTASGVNTNTGTNMLTITSTGITANTVISGQTPTTNSHLATKLYVDGKVSLTGNETIAGIKTFSSPPIVPTAEGLTEAINLGQVQGLVGTVGLQQVTDVNATTTNKIGIGAVSIDASTKRLKVGDTTPTDAKNFVAVTETFDIDTTSSNGINVELYGNGIGNNSGRGSRAVKSVAYIDPKGFSMTNVGGSALGIEGVARVSAGATGTINVITGAYARVLGDSAESGITVNFGNGLIIPAPSNASPTKWGRAIGINVNSQATNLVANQHIDILLGNGNANGTATSGLPSDKDYGILNYSLADNYFRSRLSIGSNLFLGTELLRVNGTIVSNAAVTLNEVVNLGQVEDLIENITLTSSSLSNDSISLTADTQENYFASTGALVTFTLPPVAGNLNKKLIIVNKGTDTLTMETDASDTDIWHTGTAFNSYPLAVGYRAILFNDGTHWVIIGE